MGLQGQLNDVGWESIPLYLVALLASLFGFIRSLLRFGSSKSESDPIPFLSEQLSLNRCLSYSYSESGRTQCVFCLNRLRSGDRVRKLSCSHVFHKHCLDGWLHQINFTCPLCRSQIPINAQIRPFLFPTSSPAL